jgi:hypothetical protein
MSSAFEAGSSQLPNGRRLTRELRRAYGQIGFGRPYMPGVLSEFFDAVVQSKPPFGFTALPDSGVSYVPPGVFGARIEYGRSLDPNNLTLQPVAAIRAYRKRLAATNVVRRSAVDKSLGLPRRAGLAFTRWGRDQLQVCVSFADAPIGTDVYPEGKIASGESIAVLQDMGLRVPKKVALNVARQAIWRAPVGIADTANIEVATEALAPLERFLPAVVALDRLSAVHLPFPEIVHDANPEQP